MYGEEVSNSARKEKVPGTEDSGSQCSTEYIDILTAQMWILGTYRLYFIICCFLVHRHAGTIMAATGACCLRCVVREGEKRGGAVSWLRWI